MSRERKNDDKTRVSLYVDTKVVDCLKHIAGQSEAPYQPLMNKILRDWYEALPPEQKYHNR
jgi:uncharacterized protein (DUF4415 family)